MVFSTGRNVEEKELIDVENFSSFHRLLLVTAWINRFRKNIMAKKNKTERILDCELGVQEIVEAEIILIKFNKKV